MGALHAMVEVAGGRGVCCLLWYSRHFILVMITTLKPTLLVLLFTAETKQTAVRSKLEAIGYFVTSLISNTVLSHNRIRGGVPTAAVVCKLTFYVKPMAQGRWALLYASHLHLAQNVPFL